MGVRTREEYIEDLRKQKPNVYMDGEKMTVEDLGSSNGTYLNGTRITTTVITNGDDLRLGNCSFAVEIEGEETPGQEDLQTDSSLWDLSTHSISPEELEIEATGIRSAGLTGASTGAVLGFFQQAGRILERAFDIDELLSGILDLTFQMIQAERGFVLLANMDTGEMEIKASIGAAIFPEDGEEIADLVTRADMAMYGAKKQGKNTFMFSTDVTM